MNEHIMKGKDALASGDLRTALDEFKLAKKDSSILTRRIAEKGLEEIKERKLSESKTGEKTKIQTNEDSSKFGYLSSDFGYHVGCEGIPKRERRDKLRDAFFDETILKEERWEAAGSIARFRKFCSWLEFRIGSNHDELKMAEAVADWRDDLQWLETAFIKEVFPEKDSE
jgi:hypothetical protein